MALRDEHGARVDPPPADPYGHLASQPSAGDASRVLGGEAHAATSRADELLQARRRRERMARAAAAGGVLGVARLLHRVDPGQADALDAGAAEPDVDGVAVGHERHAAVGERAARRARLGGARPLPRGGERGGRFHGDGDREHEDGREHSRDPLQARAR